MQQFQGITIHFENDTWTVLGTGVVTKDGVYCHLASTTRVHLQKNGNVPVQVSTFVPFGVLTYADEIYGDTQETENSSIQAGGER